MARLKMNSIISIFLLFYISGTFAARNRQPFQYAECRLPASLGVGKDSVTGRAPTVPNHALWASTYSSNMRMPYMARLEDPTGAWTASVQNSLQFLAVDFGGEFIVTQVLTQGRQGSDEFVTEFMLEYSTDNRTWTEYTNEFGLTEIFYGNSDGNNVVRNNLPYPIVCKYLRFRPLRWNMFISMRVDVHGCRFYSDPIKVGSDGYIFYNLANLNVTKTQTDQISLRFRTTKPHGVLLYADGNQGDLIALELNRGYISLKIDLGSTTTVPGLTTVTGGSMVDDGQWHDVIIRRNKSDVLFTVDRLETSFETQGLFYRLDLDKMIFLGGVDSFNRKGITTRYNFDGCIDFVRFNGINMIRDAKNQQNNFRPGQGNNQFGQPVPMGRFGQVGPVGYSCQLVTDVPCTFASLESYLLLDGMEPDGVVKAKFQFRTHDEDGLLLYHQMNDPSEVRVRLDREGFVRYTVVSLSGQIVEDVVRNIDVESPTQTFTDGLWHQFYMYIDNTMVNVTVDRNSKVSKRTMEIRSGTDYFIGGSALESGFRGCMRNVEVGSTPIDLTAMTPDKANLVQIGSCKIRDKCTPSPCEHGGMCTQNWDNFYCDCEDTGYKGQVCHISAHQLSCEIHNMYSDVPLIRTRPFPAKFPD